MNFYTYRYMLWHGGRQSATAHAAINYTEHDKRYHHGNFDPKTMTCEMREAEAKGDLVDVLNAEEEEADYAKRKRNAALSPAIDRAEKESKIMAVEVPPEYVDFRIGGKSEPFQINNILASNSDTARKSIPRDSHHRPEIKSAKRFLKGKYSVKMDAQAKFESRQRGDPVHPDPVPFKIGGTGDDVYLSSMTVKEYAASQNSLYLQRYAPEAYYAKMGLWDHLAEVLKNAVPFHLNVPEGHTHNSHKAYFKNGFDYYAVVVAARDRKGDIHTYPGTVVINKHEDGTRYFYDIIVDADTN